MNDGGLMKSIVEICCGSYEDCIKAQIGGADRVELNSALYLGGLTPSVGSLVLTKQHTALKVITMVRPRGAGFHYNEYEFAAMLKDVEIMLSYGADGIAFGCLNEDGSIHIEQTKQIIDMIQKKGKEIVFHRAFDCVSNPQQAIEILISLGVDRILTSGCMPKAPQGKNLLRQLQTTYGNNIQLLMGSGVNHTNAKELIEYTGISQIHSSCKNWCEDVTTCMHHVSYAYGDGEHESAYDIVDENLVRKLVQSIK